MPTGPTRIAFDLGGKVHVSPPIWTEHELDVHPGDLSRFAPQGNGVYGFQDPAGNPFTGAPSQEAAGGIIYFGNDISQDDFFALMRIMGVLSDHRILRKDFAAYTSESEQPGEDGHLVQLRLVSKFGMRYMFGALDSAEYDRFPEQELGMAEAFWYFIERERKRWGTSFTQDAERGLHGLFGGDGNFAREELAFGFMLENEYHQIYRIWSRAWLVTK